MRYKIRKAYGIPAPLLTGRFTFSVSWSRVLTKQEIGALWSDGNGLEFPFT